jgi:hypothetical protein
VSRPPSTAHMPNSHRAYDPLAILLTSALMQSADGEGETMSGTWIFQANPDQYDISSFLDSGHKSFLFLVNQNKNSLSIRDTVYLWRSVGKSLDTARSGIIAECEISDNARDQVDDEISRNFWLIRDRQDSIRPRVRLQIRNVGALPLRRDYLKHHPILSRLTILRMANATNFRVAPDQAEALKDEWSRIPKK